MDVPSRIAEAGGVKKEDPDETSSSPEATVAAGAGAGAGGERVSAVKPEPSTVGKRKRGRPRKSAVDPAPAPPKDASPAPAASRAPPPPAEPSSAAGHERGRPKRAFKIKLMQMPPSGLRHTLGPAFKPFVLTVPEGCDIIQELSSYVQDDDITLVPFSATGEVSSIMFYGGGGPDGEKTHYEGRFVINVLQGSLNRKYGMLSLMMTDPQGQFIGGSLAGPLVAGNHVQIIFGTYSDVMERKNKRKQRSDNDSAAAAAQTENDVDDGELVDVPIRVGEVAGGDANGGSPGPEGSEEEEPIMAIPITIVPPASSLPEGSDEEEPIMATPIAAVPPASSLPETPEDENESADICGSDSEK